MQIPGLTFESKDGRFGFQGQERDTLSVKDEIAGAGNTNSTFFRWNSTQTLGWHGIDPKSDIQLMAQVEVLI